MQIKIAFQNMDHSDPVEQHTRQKLEKLHELLKSFDQIPPFFVEFHLKSNKLHPHHAAELHLKTAVFDLNAHDEGTDMYVVIDNTIDKMVNLVRKEKSKNKDKKNKPSTDKKSFANDKDKFTLS